MTSILASLPTYLVIYCMLCRTGQEQKACPPPPPPSIHPMFPPSLAVTGICHIIPVSVLPHHHSDSVRVLTSTRQTHGLSLKGIVGAASVGAFNFGGAVRGRQRWGCDWAGDLLGASKRDTFQPPVAAFKHQCDRGVGWTQYQACNTACIQPSNALPINLNQMLARQNLPA